MSGAEDPWAKHEAIYFYQKLPTGWTLEWLRWKEPGNSTYAMWFVRNGPWLYISGDLYESVFQWSTQVSLRAISECNLDYYASKCKASSCGRAFESWDADHARETLEWHLKPQKGDDQETIDEKHVALELFEEKDGWEAISNEFEWQQWACDYASDIFGGDWGEFLGSPGMCLDWECKIQFEGLQRAIQWLEENNVEYFGRRHNRQNKGGFIARLKARLHKIFSRNSRSSVVA